MAGDAVEEESLSRTILSEENAFWQGVSHEVCAGARKLRQAAEFLRTRRSRTRWPTTKGVKAKEKVAQKVEPNSKKPHRAAGELTLSERKFETENTAEKKEVSDENNQGVRVVRTLWWRRQCVEQGWALLLWRRLFCGDLSGTLSERV